MIDVYSESSCVQQTPALVSPVQEHDLLVTTARARRRLTRLRTGFAHGSSSTTERLCINYEERLCSKTIISENH